MEIRYIVRKEFFGAIVYDKLEDSYLAFDEEFFYTLLNLSNGEKAVKINDEVYSLLVDEGFVVDGKTKYKIIINEQYGETLTSPARVHFYYTSKCNLNCAHCFSKKHPSKEELTFQEKVKLLDQMEALGVNEILIGGGEPFITDDFLSFVPQCTKRGIVTKVFTNGLLLTDEIIEKISDWNLAYLSVSIDGTTDDEYAITRGVAALSDVKKKILKLKQSCKYPVAISITVNNFNHKNVEEYLMIAKETNVDRIKIRPTKPSGNVNENTDVYLSPSKYLEFIKKMQKEWNNRYKGSFRLDFSWGDSRIIYNKCTDSMEVINVPFPYEGYGCFAGKGSIVIDADGYASPCGFLPISMQNTKEDNIKVKSLKDIWDTGKKFNNLRNLKGNETCINCEYYGTCRGGCIARILYEGKKLTDVDPWCLAKFFPSKID